MYHDCRLVASIEIREDSRIDPDHIAAKGGTRLGRNRNESCGKRVDGIRVVEGHAYDRSWRINENRASNICNHKPLPAGDYSVGNGAEIVNAR